MVIMQQSLGRFLQKREMTDFFCLFLENVSTKRTEIYIFFNFISRYLAVWRYFTGTPCFHTAPFVKRYTDAIVLGKA